VSQTVTVAIAPGVNVSAAIQALETALLALVNRGTNFDIPDSVLAEYSRGS